MEKLDEAANNRPAAERRLSPDEWEGWIDRRITNLEKSLGILIKVVGILAGASLGLGLILGWALEYFRK